MEVLLPGVSIKQKQPFVIINNVIPNSKLISFLISIYDHHLNTSIGTT